MTADPRLRRRRTQVGAALAVVLFVVATVAVIIGASTLRTSEAGSAPPSDPRVQVGFPSTPTVAIGVVDDQDRLASLVVGVLSPSGVGGSLVSVPVNVDSSIGFGDTRSPVSSRPYTVGDAESLESLTISLESILSITVQHALILGPDELRELVDRVAPVDVDLPDDVVDSDGGDESGAEIVAAGSATLDGEVFAAALTAIDVDGPTYSHHGLDVALWEAFAETVSAGPLDAEVPLGVDGLPIDPTTADEALERLLSGPIAHRDLAVDQATEATLSTAGDVDFVLVDRSDAFLVFGEIAPALVSTPNESLSFQIIARFTDDQIVASGVESTTVGLVSDLIGELLFAQGNIVSVQTSPSAEGAPGITRLEVADPSFIDAVTEVAPVLFGEVEVVEATRLIDGVDVVAVLGTPFLDRRAEIAAETAATSTTVADTAAPDETETAITDAVDSDGAGSDGPASTDETDTTSDTVATDE